MRRRVAKRALFWIVAAVAIVFAAGFTAASLLQKPSVEAKLSPPGSSGRWDLGMRHSAHRRFRPLKPALDPAGQRSTARNRPTETGIVRIGAPKITNHQRWSQVSRHFDTQKIEEARQVLGGVCYLWESAPKGRRWRVIACWEDAPAVSP